MQPIRYVGSQFRGLRISFSWDMYLMVGVCPWGPSWSFGCLHRDPASDRPRLSLAISRLCNVNDVRVARRRQLLHVISYGVSSCTRLKAWRRLGAIDGSGSGDPGVLASWCCCCTAFLDFVWRRVRRGMWTAECISCTSMHDSCQVVWTCAIPCASTSLKTGLRGAPYWQQRSVIVKCVGHVDPSPPSRTLLLRV